jgi:hypothetical protein
VVVDGGEMVNRKERVYKIETIISESDVYHTLPDCPIPVPKEHEIVDFRPPKFGERYMNEVGEICVAGGDFVDDQPRLILKRKETVYHYIPNGIGCPKTDDFYISPATGEILRSKCDSNYPYLLYRRIEVTE